MLNLLLRFIVHNLDTPIELHSVVQVMVFSKHLTTSSFFLPCVCARGSSGLVWANANLHASSFLVLIGRWCGI